MNKTTNIQFRSRTKASAGALKQMNKKRRKKAHRIRKLTLNSKNHSLMMILRRTAHNKKMFKHLDN